MQSEDRALTIEELADQAGTSVRTIRFYITEGLLPGPGARGKAAAYVEEHLLRLNLIRRLVEQRVPLSEIRERMASLSIDDIRSLLAEDDRRIEQFQRTIQTQSPKDYVSALLDRAREARQTASREAPDASLTQRPRQSMPLPAPSQVPQPEETWQRWELAPGVELHVKSDAKDRFRRLIEHILRIAGVSPHP